MQSLEDTRFRRACNTALRIKLIIYILCFLLAITSNCTFLDSDRVWHESFYVVELNLKSCVRSFNGDLKLISRISI